MNSVASPSGSNARLHGATLLARTSVVLLVALPLAMWAANRSATLVIGLAAAASLGAALLTGEGRALAGRCGRALASPTGASLAAFLAWALLSLGWTHRPAAGLAMWGELVLPVASGAVIMLAGCVAPTRGVARALALSLAAAAILTVVELKTGVAARALLGLRINSFIFNRPAIVCLLLLAPALHLLWRGRGVPAIDRPIGALALASVAVAVAVSDSGAAQLGLAVLALGWIAGRLLPRLSLVLTAAAFAATMAAAPVIGLLADKALPATLHEELADSHSRDRVDIWLSFGEAIRARPVIGSGFGSSAALRSHPVAAQVSETRQILLDVGHPHSAPVQIWTETGAIGAALLLFAGLGLLWRLRHLAAAELAPRLASFACGFAIAAIGHGAWQGWWIAVLAAVTIWFALDPELKAGNSDG